MRAAESIILIAGVCFATGTAGIGLGIFMGAAGGGAETLKDRSPYMPALALLLFIPHVLLAGINLSGILLRRIPRQQGSIGLLKAFGAARKDILRSLFMEAFLLSLFGAAGGTGLSIMAHAAGRRLSPFWRFPAPMVAVGIAGAWFVILASTLVPVVRISGMEAAEAMDTSA